MKYSNFIVLFWRHQYLVSRLEKEISCCPQIIPLGRGRNVKNLKKSFSLKLGFSQELFAEELSWTRSVVGSYEEGRSEPSIERLIRLSHYFNIPIDDLNSSDIGNYLCDCF